MTERKTLADLIRDHQATTHDSYSDIARKSGLSKAKIGQLARTGGTHAPRLDTIEKLAVGLRLPLEAVKAAAMATAGIGDGIADESQEITIMVDRYKQLPARDQRTARDVIESLYQRAATHDE